MKPNSGSEHEASLDGVLRQWTVKTPLPPRFEEQVWSRIQRAEAQPVGWARWRRLVEVALPRPRFAVAYLSAFLALGVAAGAVTAQRKASRLDAQLGLRYVQSLDPYLLEAAQR